MSFLTFLRDGLAAGGWPTHDALAAFLPLLRQIVAAHQAGCVAPLAGVEELVVEEGRLGFPETARRPPAMNPAALRGVEQARAHAVEVVAELRVTGDLASDRVVAVEDLQIGDADAEITRPLYLPGYVTWDQRIGQHDAVSDVFSAGLLLASLACGLDFTRPEDLRRFVQGRRNLFEIRPELHPVIAKAIVKLTELDRQRRPQDLAAVLRTLENYRDQEIDFEFELARLPGFKAAPLSDQRRTVLSTLQRRLFEISRRNRLLHFRQTNQTLNLTVASVPVSLQIERITPNQLLTWTPDVQKTLAAGRSLSLSKLLCFDEALYLPGQLDQILAETRRNQAEFGFEQLRLVIAFLRWSNLKEKPADSFDSPLLLLPVKLVKKKGVRDAYVLEPTDTEAELNPVVRHLFRQLYNIELPETLDIESTDVVDFYRTLAAQIQASEPAVSVNLIDKPRIRLIHAKAQRRIEQYEARAQRARSRDDVPSESESAPAADAAPQDPADDSRALIGPLAEPMPAAASPVESPRVAGVESAEQRGVTAPDAVPAPAVEEVEQRMYHLVAEGEANPYTWEFDLCSLTLGNFRYRKMSLVRDYAEALEQQRVSEPFEAIFSLAPRPAPEPPSWLPLAEACPVLPSDPTQMSAVACARRGQSYIIQGPPGTGKSQTIANLIADYVHQGKRVLFVCEKRAAIDVVYHRLQQLGLKSLCSLIHDSQADKKAFVLDLKETYEAWLQDDGPEDAAEKDRKKGLKSIQKELEPLQAWDAALRSAPEAAGLPLRQVLERAIEVAERASLPPAEREALPPYRCWLSDRPALDRFAAELARVNVASFAAHPLRRVSPELARGARPYETLSKHLDAARTALTALTSRLAEAGIELARPLTGIAQFLAYAQAAFPFAQRDLFELTTTGPVASEFARTLADIQRKTHLLQAARQETVPWTSKLAPADTDAALALARKHDGSWLRFLDPGWWRLRGVLRRSYNFAAHVLPPTDVVLLTKLAAEHHAAADLAQVETSLRDRFRWDAPSAAIAAARDQFSTIFAQAAPEVVDLHHRLAQLPAAQANAQLRALAQLQPVVEELRRELDACVVGAAELPLTDLADELARIAGALDQFDAFLPCLEDVAGMSPELAEALRRVDLPLPALEQAAAEQTLLTELRRDRRLARFDGSTRERQLDRLKRAHDEIFGLQAAAVLEVVRRRFRGNVRLSETPHAQLATEQKEFKTQYNKGRRELEHEFGKTMRYKSIRDLASGATGTVLRDLKPVWLMSPLSVSDTLPLSAGFDVVIFDEASQITLEEAVPAVFRAPQVIVVGDQMQLPPTSFFATRRSEEEDVRALADDGEEVEYDLGSSSFLDHAARNLSNTLLGWHYRSRSESLIGFSNAAFYQGRLRTVPEEELPAESQPEIIVADPTQAEPGASAIRERPLSFHRLPRGVYENRRNRAEATYIARLVRSLLQSEDRPSLGVVAFSEAQQQEIEEALDELAREDAEFSAALEEEWEREDDGQFAGLLVKNLENIQGDERDVIILSVCYAPRPDGKMLMNFGPINQSGGERRLNVAFSRARQAMVVVSSIQHHQITNDANDGARALKNYLRYAAACSLGDREGALRVLRDVNPAGPSASETAVAENVVARQLADELRTRGWRVDLSIGQSSFRVDLAVWKPGDRRYRLGVLIDSVATYAQSDIIERDLLRPQLLARFGWTITHVLASDWLADRAGVLGRIEKQLASGAT